MEKIIDIEDRIPTLKARRRRRTNRKFSILLLLFVTTILIVLYFQSSYSQIQTITIGGAVLVPKEQYMEQSSLKLGESMWGFGVKDIREKIEQNDWVKSVEVDRNWLTAVHIQVDEYKQVAYMEKEGHLQSILENGKFLQTDGQVLPIDGPIISGFDDEKIRIRLIKELKKLNIEVLWMISQINYTPTTNDAYSIQLFMNDGNEVLSLIPSFSEKMNFYPSIVSQIEPGVKGVIDLEVGSFFQSYDALYRPKETTEEEAVNGEVVEEDEEQTP
ncbi:FtsQ-type POTRA domain-containing protein [Psychrobacillus sp.]|uniref:cell division protein FtsQ/DivIB n=1 Tax=Psychrobacillus sp. TaxID=1871623 RepID=UPI0028BE6C02|nr:FtsQ-type POTRA domain-containing protein [Psychrobacillus sp.]